MICDCGRVFDSQYAYAGHRKAHRGEPVPCGTTNGYRHGCRCDDCTAAKYAVVKAYRAAHPGYDAERSRVARARRRKPRPDPPACGTPGGWWRHHRSGEPPCQPCWEAVRDYNRSRRAIRRRRARRGHTWQVVADHLEVHGPITRGALFDLIWERHPDLSEATMRDALGKLRRIGVAVLDPEDRWRLARDWTEIPSLGAARVTT